MKPEVYGLDYICGYIYIYIERIYLFMRIDKQNIHVPIDIIISSLSYFRLIVVYQNVSARICVYTSQTFSFGSI